jgi:hypothetical protein
MIPSRATVTTRRPLFRYKTGTFATDQGRQTMTGNPEKAEAQAAVWTLVA